VERSSTVADRLQRPLAGCLRQRGGGRDLGMAKRSRERGVERVEYTAERQRRAYPRVSTAARQRRARPCVSIEYSTEK
jgi:hypothetical protein